MLIKQLKRGSGENKIVKFHNVYALMPLIIMNNECIDCVWIQLCLCSWLRQEISMRILELITTNIDTINQWLFNSSVEARAQHSSLPQVRVRGFWAPEFVNFK